jgi:hypothetical protein
MAYSGSLDAYQNITWTQFRRRKLSDLKRLSDLDQLNGFHVVFSSQFRVSGLGTETFIITRIARSGKYAALGCGKMGKEKKPPASQTGGI